MNRTLVAPVSAADEVLSADELARRPSRAPDLAAENRALVALTREMAESPGTILQRLADVALELCRADSTGVTILEPDGTAFRWHAAAGQWRSRLGETMPREASPCGTALDHNRPLLIVRPERFYTAMLVAEPPVSEVLLVPFYVRGKPAGTLWAIAHGREATFDAEDQRILENLSCFAAAAFTLHERTRAAEDLRASHAAALNLMEDALVARQQAERAEFIESAQNRALQLAMEDAPLDQILEKLVQAVEEQSTSDLVGSILLLDADDVRLRHAAGRNLPDAFKRAVDGLTIGPAAGSCGTAAFRKKPVHVADIATDPLWSEYREAALSNGLRACWSTPILSRLGDVLGTFAMYYREARLPNDSDRRLVELTTRTAALLIERKQAEAALRASEERYRNLFESIDEGFCICEMIFDADGQPVDYRFVEANPAFEKHTGLKDIVGKTARQLAPELEQWWVDTYSKVALTHEPVRFEHFAAPANQWFDVYASRIGDEGSRKVAIVFTNTTERKLNEQVLRQATEALAASNTRLEQKVIERTRQLERRSEQLRALAVQLTQTEARERQRIAQILHDQLQQLIIAAKYKLQAKVRKGETFAPVMELLDEGVKAARSLAYDISPPALHHPDFVTALESLAEKAKEQFGLRVAVTATEKPVSLRDEQKVILYESARELLFNAFKYAKVKQARLRWSVWKTCLILRVEDKGAGFDPARIKSERHEGFGLFSIRERLQAMGGGLILRSRPKRGTKVALVLPYRPKKTSRRTKSVTVP